MTAHCKIASRNRRGLLTLEGMFKASLLALAAALLAGCASSGGFRIVHVWTDYRDAESFVRVSEYFDGKENPGRQILLRSDPDHREGFYFLTRVSNPGPAIDVAQFELQVIAPDSPQTHVFTFKTHVPHGSQVWNVGVTGADWKVSKTRPVAWYLRLLDAEGKQLAEQQSFLWSKRDGA